jgi:hypothetical protein
MLEIHVIRTKKPEQIKSYELSRVTYRIHWNGKANPRWCTWRWVYSSIYTYQVSSTIKKWTSAVTRVDSSISLYHILYRTSCCSWTNFSTQSTRGKQQR